MTYEPVPLSVVKFLLSLSEAEQAKLADKDETWGRMIFRDGLPIRLEGTGKRAIVVKQSTPGTSDAAHVSRGIVSISLYADHTRSEGEPPAVEDGIDRAWAMFGNLDHHMQAAKPLVEGARTVQSDRQAQPLESFDQDQDLAYLAVTYDVTLFQER
jgi:hypothetical protein